MSRTPDSIREWVSCKSLDLFLFCKLSDFNWKTIVYCTTRLCHYERSKPHLNQSIFFTRLILERWNKVNQNINQTSEEGALSTLPGLWSHLLLVSPHLVSLFYNFSVFIFRSLNLLTSSRNGKVENI